jgi:hypothetical protein
VSSADGGQVLLDVKHYSRLMAALVANTASTADLMASPSGMALAAGSVGASRQLIGNTQPGTTVGFSIALAPWIDSMLSADLDLSKYGGLRFDIELASSSAVLLGADAATFTYALSDVHLDFSTVDRTLRDQKKAVAVSYDSIQVALRSGRSIATIQAPSPAVLSTFTTFISNSASADPTEDYNGLQVPDGLQSILFRVGGKNYPFPEALQCDAPGFPSAFIRDSGFEAVSGLNAIKGRSAGTNPQVALDAQTADSFVAGCRYPVPTDLTQGSGQPLGIEVVSSASTSAPWIGYVHLKYAFEY